MKFFYENCLLDTSSSIPSLKFLFSFYFFLCFVYKYSPKALRTWYNNYSNNKILTELFQFRL